MQMHIDDRGEMLIGPRHIDFYRTLDVYVKFDQDEETGRLPYEDIVAHKMLRADALAVYRRELRRHRNNPSATVIVYGDETYAEYEDRRRRIRSGDLPVWRHPIIGLR